MVEQGVEFQVGVGAKPISVTARDAERLVNALLAASPEARAARKIERANDLHGDQVVTLSVGEDEAVLRALAQLRETGDFLQPLVRLERAIKTKLTG